MRIHFNNTSYVNLWLQKWIIYLSIQFKFAYTFNFLHTYKLQSLIVWWIYSSFYNFKQYYFRLAGHWHYSRFKSTCDNYSSINNLIEMFRQCWHNINQQTIRSFNKMHSEFSYNIGSKLGFLYGIHLRIVYIIQFL